MAEKRFDSREWVDDMITGAVTGLVTGFVGALFVPDPPVALAAAAGGMIGLVAEMIEQPLRWLLHQRPGPPNDSKGDQS